MDRAALLLPLLLGVSACAAPQVVPGPADPILLRYKTPQQGGPTTFPEAHIFGSLDFSGPCVRLQLGERGSHIVVAPSDLSLGRDRAGLYLQSGSQRLRHGMDVEGGGGFRSSLLDNILERAAPAECRKEGFVDLTGPNRYDPSKVPPPISPPPPPSN